MNKAINIHGHRAGGKEKENEKKKKKATGLMQILIKMGKLRLLVEGTRPRLHVELKA